MTKSKALIGRKAICDFLKISPNTFYKLVQEGLPAVRRAGGTWTAHADDIEAFFLQGVGEKGAVEKDA